MKSAPTLFHAFNMPYRAIESLAPVLREQGFTHVQFPPIQTARTLSECDGVLLRAQAKLCTSYISQVYELADKVRNKAALYAPHTFDFLLKEHIACVNQPTVRAAYEAALSGTSYTDLYETVLRSGTSPIAAAVLDCAVRGQRSPWHPLVRAADLVLVGRSPKNRLEFAKLDAAIADADAAYRAAAIGSSAKSAARTTLLRLKSERHSAEESAELAAMLETTARLRKEMLECTEFAVPAKRLGGDAANHWNRVVILEFMVYPPWWIVYQPTQFAIGATPLGSVEDIEAAISACRSHGLGVIADVVVNNLAAIATGERAAWAPYAAAAAAKSDVHTFADILETSDAASPQILCLKERILDALGTDDLTALLPPYECTGTQEPTRCWMSLALPQLNQDHDAVRAAQTAFLEQLAAVGVTGLRIDAAVHMSPAHCRRILDTFAAFRRHSGDDLSYIEYVGGSESWRAFPFASYCQANLGMEDFAIGECLYKTLFAPRADLERSKNYGGSCLSRHPSLDSVVMLINHDQMQRTLPSDIYTDLPSRLTYDLSLVYLLQRIYGAVLLLPHQCTSPVVQRALEFRAHMRARGIVRDYVEVLANSAVLRSYKYDAAGTCLAVCTLDLTRETSTEAVTFVWNPAPLLHPHGGRRQTLRWRARRCGRRLTRRGRRSPPPCTPPFKTLRGIEPSF